MLNLTPPPAFIAGHAWWPREAQQWLALKSSPQQHKALVATIQNTFIEAFKSGAATSEVIIGYAITMDHLLWYAWFSHHLHTSGAALLAVGGYGRAELHLHSDIDLMVLLDKNFSQQEKDRLTAFLTFLWDSGLDIGHSVRTLKEAIAESKKDVTVISSLLEARAICGNTALFKALLKATAANKIWDSKKFYFAKKDEKQQRHKKFGDTLYQLEPNVKEGPGGLRDIQFIDWITKRHFGNRALGDLVGNGFLLEEEYNQLRHAQEYLWKTRFSLYLISQRKEERLLFDYQVELARAAGHSDLNSNLAVEQFMQNYYRHIRECYQLTDLLQAHFEETCIAGRIWRKPKKIGACFIRKGNVLCASHDRLFKQHPEALLQLFLVMQQNQNLDKISSNTVRLIRNNLHLIDGDFRHNEKHKKLFIDILRQPRFIARELQRMHQLGILAAYWPAFARIVGRMQYDLYHVYTVDHHILTVLKEARQLGDNKRTEDDISAIFHTLPKHEILYLAALLHDVAKGRETDHSTAGAQEAMAFCLAHGLSQYDAALVSWLVENHLLMSMTAQHSDLSDPGVVQAFADKTASVIRLNYLYMLTIADIKGTNPSLWNSWRATLLADLYKYTCFQLRAAQPRDNRQIIQDIKTSALELLAQQGHSRQHCQAFWSELTNDYFLRHTDNEIAWHTGIALTTSDCSETQVHIHPLIRGGCTEIFIYTRDRKHLFANITCCLHRLDLSILDARIITSKRAHALNTFTVTDHRGASINNEKHCRQIKKEIIKALREKDLADYRVSQFLCGRLKHFQAAPEITIQNARRLDHTNMNIYASDHPGLLASIAHALASLEIKVVSARVSTLGEKVHDIFYICTKDNKKILDQQQQQLLIRQLKEKLTFSSHSATA